MIVEEIDQEAASTAKARHTELENAQKAIWATTQTVQSKERHHDLLERRCQDGRTPLAANEPRNLQPTMVLTKMNIDSWSPDQI